MHTPVDLRMRCVPSKGLGVEGKRQLKWKREGKMKEEWPEPTLPQPRSLLLLGELVFPGTL
jgi:hypothetical protein